MFPFLSFWSDAVGMGYLPSVTAEYISMIGCTAGIHKSYGNNGGIVSRELSRHCTFSHPFGVKATALYPLTLMIIEMTL
jgi:hypothetical protein